MGTGGSPDSWIDPEDTGPDTRKLVLGRVPKLEFKNKSLAMAVLCACVGIGVELEKKQKGSPTDPFFLALAEGF